MLTVRRTRTIHASREEVWDVLGDPHHLPRWWPRVSRVEAVTAMDTDGQDAAEGGAFTEVLTGSSGKIVRADFRLLGIERSRRIAWSQEVEGTPFERVLKSAETEITLTGDDTACEVAIELRQELQGFRGQSAFSLRIAGISRFGSPLVRRAAASTINDALDGLQRIVGPGD
jgi:uncharacterized protein YndB with AHSA1/START domain